MHNFDQSPTNNYDIDNLWDGGTGKRTQFKIVKPLIVSAQNAVITKRSQRNISIKSTMI